MHIYNLAVLFFAYSSLLLSILICLKRQDSVAKHFLIFSIFTSLWALSFAYSINTMISADNGFLFALLDNFFAIFIPPSWLKFIFVFIGKDQERKNIIRGLYGLSLVIACTAPTPLFMPGAKIIPHHGWHYPIAGLTYHVYAFEFFAVVLYGFWELLAKLRSQHGGQRKQTAIFLLATGLGFFGGSFCFAPVYDIPLPQYGLFLLPLYPFLLTYAMIRHGLLDQEEVLAVHRDKLALLGLMSSSITHEIKNPLFLLQEYTRKALRVETVNHSPDAVEALDKMDEQIARMKKLVTRLSEFGKPNPHPGTDEEVDLAQTIESSLFFASQELKYLNVEVKLNIAPDLPKLKGDKSQFEEIFLNLIVNAYHAMPSGGVLTIEARSQRSEVGSQRDEVRSTRGEVLHITISDTGTGISKDQLKQIFKPFYTTKEKTGTGLGLHIVKTLVEQNKGKLTVESELGKGTRFSLYFPAGSTK